MKYIRFMAPGKEAEVGILLEGNRVIPASSFVPGLKKGDMMDFIKHAGISGGLPEPPVSGCLGEPVYDLDSVRLLAPIERPVHDILCVGVNYEDHLKETEEHLGEESFKKPPKAVYFSKRALRLMGPDGRIEGRLDVDEALDYEVELAVIIGKDGKKIPACRAEEYIFGYSIFNDISSRNLQTAHGQWFYGKSLDTYASMGPVIVGREELPFPVELEVKSFVNGQLRQHSNTRSFIHGIPWLISELSQCITLECGDIIATGTPSGVGMGYDPPRYMKKGDQVTCEIETIGKLTNRIG